MSRQFTPAQVARRRATSKRWAAAHRDLMHARSKAWALAHPERTLQIEQKRNKKKWHTSTADARRQKATAESARRRAVHVEAVMHYGGKCHCCGETIPQLLTLDHIHGGGSKHRKELKGSKTMATWAKQNKWPPIFRVACHACNFGTYINKGVCPHAER